MRNLTPDQKLRRVARRQHGLFTLAQALEAGFKPWDLSRRVKRGVWESLEPNVFRSAVAAKPTWIEETAALALSVDGLAYGASSLALCKILDNPPKEPDVLVVRKSRGRARPGLHSTIALPPSDIVVVRGIRAVRPARAVTQYGNTHSAAELATAVDRTVALGFASPESLWRRSRELVAPSRPGAARTLRAVATQHRDIERVRSVWEARVLRLFAEWGLPPPECNYEVDIDGQTRILDCAWLPWLVGFEFDGFYWHSRRGMFDDDRQRQNDLVDVGWRIFRATSNTLERQPARLRDALRRALGVA